MQKKDKKLDIAKAGVSQLGGMGIGIKRIGHRVQIHFQCGGDYQAIELYDRLVDGAQRGKVMIEMKERS